jgi:hypothetical protein
VTVAAPLVLRPGDGDEESRKIDGPEVRVALRYDTPHNSRSLVLCGSWECRPEQEGDSEATPVILPNELARKLRQRREKYLAAEEQIVDHLRDTGQPAPR